MIISCIHKRKLHKGLIPKGYIYCSRRQAICKLKKGCPCAFYTEATFENFWTKLKALFFGKKRK